MSLRDVILHNFWLKLFSIALATVIWLAIHYSIHDEANSLTPAYILVPVSVKIAGGDTRVFRITPDEVVVTAVGKDPALFQPAQKEIQVSLDLTNFTGTNISSQKLRVDAPPDIIVLQIQPTTVDVQQVAQ